MFPAQKELEQTRCFIEFDVVKIVSVALVGKISQRIKDVGSSVTHLYIRILTKEARVYVRGDDVNWSDKCATSIACIKNRREAAVRSECPFEYNSHFPVLIDIDAGRLTRRVVCYFFKSNGRHKSARYVIRIMNLGKGTFPTVFPTSEGNSGAFVSILHF